MPNQLIPPEIKNDMFYAALKMMASNPGVKDILEIGSSSGQGSTEALVEGIRLRADKSSVRLFCMEIIKERFAALANTYVNDVFVKCYNMSSVALWEYPTKEEVINFYNSTRTQLNAIPLETILSWLQSSCDQLASLDLTFNGINRIKEENGINFFDLVLIDGSEFTGEREYLAIAGARIIALDDVNAHKCFNAYQILKSHIGYRLVIENLKLRNGFAVFERKF